MLYNTSGNFRAGSVKTTIAVLRAALAELVSTSTDIDTALRDENTALQLRVAEAETRPLALQDDELRDRCLDLLIRPGKADTAVREAAVVLEDRIRKVGGLGADLYGVGLVDEALGLKQGRLIFDGSDTERQGVHQLYRGAIAFFRNPLSHRLVEDYDLTRARHVVGFVDLLLQLLREAKARHPG